MSAANEPLAAREHCDCWWLPNSAECLHADPCDTGTPPRAAAWNQCQRCGHVWDDFDPAQETCYCLDEFGRRTVRFLTDAEAVVAESVLAQARASDGSIVGALPDPAVGGEKPE